MISGRSRTGFRIPARHQIFRNAKNKGMCVMAKTATNPQKEVNKISLRVVRNHNLKTNSKFKYKPVIWYILNKYKVIGPLCLTEDLSITTKFLNTVASKPKLSKEIIEKAIIKAMKVKHKKQQSTLKRASIHIFNEKIQKKITPPRWEEISKFFNIDVDELKIVCKLPSKKFYSSAEWRYLRYHTVKKRGQACECCGDGVHNGVSIHVDHILPRSVYVEHALNMSNLQVLCEFCNLAKSNIDTTDWRAS